MVPFPLKCEIKIVQSTFTSVIFQAEGSLNRTKEKIFNRFPPGTDDLNSGGTSEQGE